MRDTIRNAEGKWAGILCQLGIDKEFLRNKHGPCPMCGGRDRFRFDNKNGSGSWFCSHCGAGYGIDLAMGYTGLDFKDAAGRIDRMTGSAQNDPVVKKPDPRIRLRNMARSLLPCDDESAVTRYLNSRGVAFSDQVKLCPRAKYFEQGKDARVFRAMVCLIQSPEGKAATYHVTYLNEDGTKADVESPKKILPPVCSWQGGAVRLFKPSPIMGIAEGIETALAVRRLYGVPCWAAVNSGNLEKFLPPEGVKKLYIFGDNDKGFEGQRAAYSLAKRIYSTVDVDVKIPEIAGQDYCDVLEATIKEEMI